MNKTEDLSIQEEIKPLFDFTCNAESAREVSDILGKTLASPEEIMNRQQLLKAFISNWHVLKDYPFYRYNLSEIQQFFDTIFIGSISNRKLRLRFMFSEKERQHKRGKLILLIRLFYAIYKNYLVKINTNVFPSDYATELDKIKTFFADFDPEKYETLFNKNKFRIRHMVELMIIITEKSGRGELAAFWKRWYLFEAYLSVTTGIVNHGFHFPGFDEKKFALKDFYHPLLENPVKNDFTSEQQVVVLTGPNMSGKSTLLKALSLCVYFAHAGLAVPASEATMPFFKNISVAINLTDSIVSGYSHFMSEVMTLKQVVRSAQTGDRCFAVFDELFRGTNIEDALEISMATIKGFTHFPNSFFFISTHLHQLKNMEEIRLGKVSTCYIDCLLTGNIPAFTYKLKEGWSDLKLGRILFEKEGLNRMLENQRSVT